MVRDIVAALPRGLGVVLVVLAQAGMVLAALLGLMVLGRGFLPWVVGVAVCLAFFNGGLYWWRQRFLALEEDARRLRLLADMNVRVNREILLNEDIELIYRTILDYLFDIFNNATTGSVLILGQDGHLTFAASRGFSEEFVRGFRLPLQDSFLHQVTGGDIREARLIRPRDFLRIETVFKPGDWDYQSVISAPIFVGDRLFGLLNLDSPVAGTYDERDVQIVERFRTQIEVGLLARERYTANIRSYQVDALTGLLTRRYFEDLFMRLIERAQRHQETFVLALFDVDGLKTVNDSFGHLAGDQLLHSVARLLHGSSRTSDFMGRLGGDEFVAVYHHTQAAAMERSLAALRAKARAKALRLGPQAVEHHPSFSYGVASFPQDGTDQQTLIACADARLYAMKSTK